jgi:hypothetical protein
VDLTVGACWPVVVYPRSSELIPDRRSSGALRRAPRSRAKKPSAHTGPHEALAAGDPQDLMRPANLRYWHARAHNEPRHSGSWSDLVRSPSGQPRGL